MLLEVRPAHHDTALDITHHSPSVFKVKSHYLSTGLYQWASPRLKTQDEVIVSKRTHISVQFNSQSLSLPGYQQRCPGSISQAVAARSMEC